MLDAMYAVMAFSLVTMGLCVFITRAAVKSNEDLREDCLNLIMEVCTLRAKVKASE